MGCRLSAVIIAKNEEERIVSCLESLRWVDEIVVIDDCSSDRTQEICRQFGATVIVRESHGDFDQQRNAGMDIAQGEWIIQLDADEVVPMALRDEILSALRTPTDVVAYHIRRLNFFLGRPMYHGGWRWKGIKLFKKSAARYVGHSVHETLDVHGRASELKHSIAHYPFQNLTQLMARWNFYSDIEAKLLRQRYPQLPLRAIHYHLAIRPLRLFWKTYVKQSGWRDGMHGFIAAIISAWAHFLTWAKYWALGLPLQADAKPTSHPWTFETHPPSWMPHGFTAVVPPYSTFRPKGEMSSSPPTGGLSAGLTFLMSILHLKARHSPPPLQTGHSGAILRKPRERLSVVVLTKNEEVRIARCLESVRFADEVIVVDGMSTDRTVEICQEFGAHVIQHPFEGSFAQERNLGMDHAQGDWVLQLDADDVVTPQFCDAVLQVLASSHPHDILKFRRKSYLMGRFMRHGGWYHELPNLVRRDAVRYEGLVHERPQTLGSTGELDADIEHHPCKQLAEFVNRHNRYTSLAAQELLMRLGALSQGRMCKRLIAKPWKTFWKSYVKKQGFREGTHGLVFAIFFAGIDLLTWAKYWELVAVQEAETIPATKTLDEQIRRRIDDTHDGRL